MVSSQQEKTERRAAKRHTIATANWPLATGHWLLALLVAGCLPATPGSENRVEALMRRPLDPRRPDAARVYRPPVRRIVLAAGSYREASVARDVVRRAHASASTDHLRLVIAEARRGRADGRRELLLWPGRDGTVALPGTVADVSAIRVRVREHAGNWRVSVGEIRDSASGQAARPAMVIVPEGSVLWILPGGASGPSTSADWALALRLDAVR